MPRHEKNSCQFSKIVLVLKEKTAGLRVEDGGLWVWELAFGVWGLGNRECYGEYERKSSRLLATQPRARS